MQVGQRLRELREGKNLSQGDIENRTGMIRCIRVSHAATERCDAAALHFPFCRMKVSVKIIAAVSGCPLKLPACEALPVTTAASP